VVGLKSQKDRPPFLDVPSIYVNGKPYSRVPKIGDTASAVSRMRDRAATALESVSTSADTESVHDP